MNDRASIVESQVTHATSHAAEPEASWCLSREDFEVFVREYADRLLAVAARFLRSQDDAEDAVQDALLAAFTYRRHFRGQSTVYTWLYRIVTNTCLMKLRAHKASKHRLIDMSRSLGESPLDFADRTSPSPGARLERAEARAVIHAKLNQLPDAYRTILFLRDIEELNTCETAQRLGLSQEAVKTRVCRARQALRSLVESSYPRYA